MKKICIILLLFVAKIYSQEILKKDEVYSENNLIYKVENSELFTGKIQSFKGKNHLTYEIEFESGVLKKSIEYYNGKEQIIAEEIYYANNRIVEKKIKYSLDHKTLWITYYNELGEKILEEDFYENKTIYRCPYLKNKKHGIVFSVNKKGVKSECKYENGKLIKN